MDYLQEIPRFISQRIPNLQIHLPLPLKAKECRKRLENALGEEILEGYLPRRSRVIAATSVGARTPSITAGRVVVGSTIAAPTSCSRSIVLPGSSIVISAPAATSFTVNITRLTIIGLIEVGLRLKLNGVLSHTLRDMMLEEFRDRLAGLKEGTSKNTAEILIALREERGGKATIADTSSTTSFLVSKVFEGLQEGRLPMRWVYSSMPP